METSAARVLEQGTKLFRKLTQMADSSHQHNYYNDQSFCQRQRK